MQVIAGFLVFEKLADGTVKFQLVNQRNYGFSGVTKFMNNTVMGMLPKVFKEVQQKMITYLTTVKN